MRFGFRRKSGGENSDETSSSVLRQVLYGQVVSSDFFARNWMALLLIVMLALVYIAGKYTCQTKMEHVRALNRELETVNAEYIRERSEYMGKVRESAMRQMIDTLHVGLSVRENPPFIIITGPQ